MKAKIGVEEMDAAEELMQESAEGWGWDWGSDGLGVVVDYLLSVSAGRCGQFWSKKAVVLIGLTRKSCSAYSNTM